MRHIIFGSVSVAVLLSGCVEHRPIRNGLRDESVYLEKAELTNPNPKLGEGSTDDGWLLKVTVVKTSSPNVLGDYAFPGFESDTQYIKFRFAEESMQMLDGRQLQNDDPANPNDNITTATERVMMEFPGSHVDIKLRESLDGERTNYLEENTEEPWQKRQKFKVDFEKASLDPITTIAWFYGDFMHECATQVSTNMVPGSFEWDGSDQYLSFVLEANYVLTVNGGCYDMVSLVQDVGTASIHYRFSFYRPGPSTYAKEVIAEKDPVNKKYGSFQVMTTFEDPITGLLSAQALIQRYNPDREDPIVYYFAEGFPPEFMPAFGQMKIETNRVLEAAGARLRVDFQPYNAGGLNRKLGDLRYSFVVWHQDIETTRGLLGYGPTAADPRTGEAISATVNLYNIGMDYYRYLIQSFLEANGATTKPDPTKAWEEIACRPGETVASLAPESRLQTQLFDEMRRTMDITEAAPNPTDDFVPSPVQQDFKDNYHRVLSELRYGEPLYNAYVWRKHGRMNKAEFRERMKMENDFMAAMEDIQYNGANPFGPAPLSSPAGIAAQAAFREQMSEWRKNHEVLQQDLRMMLNLNNISVFDELDAVNAVAGGSRQCTSTGFWESDAAYTERIIRRVVARTAIHEFGHTLSLRHNFYGSADAKHMRLGEVTASVMDYVSPIEEVGSEILWGKYDEAALTWIYGTQAKRDEVMADDYLYCTDEHAERSPLCQMFDLGVTPAQIVLNNFERYDWMYDIRNRRAFRTFWDTSDYTGRVYNSIFPPLRMWYLAIFDWGGGGVQDILKRLDQVEGKTPLTPQQYNEIAVDFYNDVQAANAMLISYYNAVINESASFRNYQTEYDPYYGDILRLGIIIDKYFTTIAFMDFQETWNYDPNVYTYVALFDVPFGDKNYVLNQKVLDNFLGANYDTFPWFQYTALEYFAWATNSNLINSVDLKERIAIRRYNTAEALNEEFPEALVDAALAADPERIVPTNPARLFVHQGEQYVYAYLKDRGYHLVAGEARNPVSFQYIKDYNDTLYASADEEADNYGLKILLALYEYYNNFVGF
ncbi:MAG: zinc-dependent metalloprotease [Deltaproteobacteria bacterium]|nr:zinc-dependent metalloprotease [Deltaproteobacteria bacterium]